MVIYLRMKAKMQMTEPIVIPKMELVAEVGKRLRAESGLMPSVLASRVPYSILVLEGTPTRYCGFARTHVHTILLGGMILRQRVS